MNNLDVFNCAVLEILHLSLNKFPIPVDVEPKVVVEAISNYFDENNFENYNASEMLAASQNTIFWLAQESFIVIKQSYSSGKCTILLTQKGLVALNVVPSIINENKSFAQHFKEGLYKLPISIVPTLMSEFFKINS